MGMFKPQIIVNADKYIFGTEKHHACGTNKEYRRSNTQIDSTYLGSGLGQMFNGAYIAKYQGDDDKFALGDDWNHLYLMCTQSKLVAAPGKAKGKTRGQEEIEK